MMAIYGRKILPDPRQKVKKTPVNGSKTPVNGSWRAINHSPVKTYRSAVDAPRLLQKVGHERIVIVSEGSKGTRANLKIEYLKDLKGLLCH